MPASREGFLNKKQELFCRFVARGSTFTEAYELAGYAPSTSNASTLAARPDIKVRINELKHEFAADEAMHLDALQRARAADAANGDPSRPETTAAIEWTINRVMDMIADNVRLAQVAGSFGAANDALKMLGDALSMFDKAKAAGTPPANPLALIGKMINHLPGGSDEDEAPQLKPANPLAPRPADDE
jgi:hypothetical protein